MYSIRYYRIFELHYIRSVEKAFCKYSIGNAARFSDSFLEIPYSISYNLNGDFSGLGLLLTFLYLSRSTGYAIGYSIGS